MKIQFSELEEKRMPEFKGGTGEYIARMMADELAKIMLGRLEPGSSIGYHRHENNCEIIYVLEGSAKCLYDDGEERLGPGECHYCPKGHSHSLINDGEEDLVFFAVVPEQ